MSLKTLLVGSTCLSKNAQPDVESRAEPGKQENDGSQSQGINLVLHLNPVGNLVHNECFSFS